MATAIAHVQRPVPPLPEGLPEPLREIAARTLAKKPADRFASAADLAAALRSGPVAPVAPPAGPAAGVERTRVLTRPPARRRALPGWVPWAGTGAALVVAVVVVALLTGRPGTASDRRSHTGSPSPSPRSSATAPARFRVSQAAFLGTPAPQASDVLTRRGFHVVTAPVDNPGDQVGGTVAGIRPHGLVARGRTLTLLVWGPPPAPKPGHPGKDEGPHGGPEHDHGHGKAKGKKKP
jgi:serine/threonine-protein kinase